MRREAQPPEVSFQQGFGSEASSMSSGGGVIYEVCNRLLLMWGNVHSTFEVQMTVGHVPVVLGRTGN